MSRQDITNFVASAMVGAEREPITYEDARITFGEWVKERMELPEGLTPEEYADEWNRQIEREKNMTIITYEARRATQMNHVAENVENLMRIARPLRDIRIEYIKPDAKSIDRFTQWERSINHIMPGDEYFLVWDYAPNWNTDRPDLLYAVNVSIDSLLTAAYDLLELLHRKF